MAKIRNISSRRSGLLHAHSVVHQRRSLSHPSSMPPMTQATRPSVPVDTDSMILPPAVTVPSPELVWLPEVPEVPDAAGVEEVAVPVAADVSSVLEGRGCPVAIDVVGRTMTYKRVEIRNYLPDLRELENERI